MKRLIPSIVLLVAFGSAAWQINGCKRTPSPPTEQDAIAVWKNIARTPHLRGLVVLKKTMVKWRKQTACRSTRCTIRQL